MRIFRSIDQPIRKFQGMDHRWRQSDGGLIWLWERGRQMAKENPSLAKRAKSGELMILNWKGGIEHKLQKPKEDGTLQYLAQWRGLRQEDLYIDTEECITLKCSLNDTEVKYSNGQPDN